MFPILFNMTRDFLTVKKSRLKTSEMITTEESLAIMHQLKTKTTDYEILQFHFY